MKVQSAMVFLGSVLLTACSSGGATPDSGSARGLTPCPSSPNCVSTEAADPEHSIAPLEYKAGADSDLARAATMEALVRTVEAMKRTRIVRRSDTYLHAEYRTLVGFVDDVEFLLDDDTGTVRFRSASRLGYSDLGVNRKRMERFREMYGALP
jgi:uncharacterized protein (DUF1499 family)